MKVLNGKFSLPSPKAPQVKSIPPCKTRHLHRCKSHASCCISVNVQRPQLKEAHSIYPGNRNIHEQCPEETG